MITLIPSDFQSTHKNQVNLDQPYNDQINFVSTLKSSQIRSPTLKSCQFRPPTLKSSQFSCSHWEIVYRCSARIQKTSQFLTPRQPPNIFHPYDENKVSSIPHRNQVKFDHLHKNQVNFHDITQNKSFSARTQMQSPFWPRTTNKSISIPTLKPSQFLSPKRN